MNARLFACKFVDRINEQMSGYGSPHSPNLGIR